MNEIKHFSFGSIASPIAPVAGTYTLSFGGHTTAAIDWDDAASAIQAALEALASIGSGNVSVTSDFNNGFYVEFVGDLADFNLGALTANSSLKQPAPTPLNQPIGHYRRFDWKAFPIDQVKEIKTRLGGAINDVVLTTVAGAVGEFLAHRDALPKRIDYRAVVPVSVRSSEEQGTGGNRVSAWLLSLPVTQRDPLKRYEAVRRTTER